MARQELQNTLATAGETYLYCYVGIGTCECECVWSEMEIFPKQFKLLFLYDWRMCAEE